MPGTRISGASRGGVLRRSNFRRAVKWYEAVAAIGAPGLHFHDLRHTGNWLEAARAPRDAQMILGHAHISTTMQIYTHVDEEARDDALTELDKLLGGGR